jgi:hypothetical protein
MIPNFKFSMLSQSQIWRTTSRLSILLWLTTLILAVAGCGEVAEVNEAGAIEGANGPLKLKAAELAVVSLGVPYKEILYFEGGIAPHKVAITNGNLFPGLTLDSVTGVISGTVEKEQTGKVETISISVTDSAGIVAEQSYTLKAATYTHQITPRSVPTIIPTIAFSMNFSVVGAVDPVSFSITGNLPTNLSLSQSGVLATSGIGVPPGSAETNWPVVINATDANGVTSQLSISIPIGTAPLTVGLNIVTTTLPAITGGQGYTAVVGVTGGTPAYSFSLSFGSLPSGLSLNASTGEISGTPLHSTAGSTYSFQVTVTDTLLSTDVQGYSVTVSPYTVSMLPATISAATPGSNYSASLTTVGGLAPYTYTLRSGTLPSGITLSSAGEITGSVAENEAGNAPSITIRATDSLGAFDENIYTLSVNTFTVAVSTTTLANAVESVAYTNSATNLSATGGTGPYTFEYTGTLPTNVGITSGGAFFGTPASGSGSLGGGTVYTINVRARDSANRLSAQKQLTLTVTVSAPAIVAGSMATAVLGNAYTETISASGGRSPYTYSVTSGSLPSGLTLVSSGAVSGTVTSPASCPANQFNVTAVDNLGQNSIAVAKCIPTVTGISISNTSFPTVVIGVSYAGSVVASGGSGTYSYTSSGLPSGVSLNPTTGALTGFTNESEGFSQNAYITVTDTSSPPLSTTRSFTFKVANPVVVSSATMNRAGTDIAYVNQTLVATGGVAPRTFAISSGALPSGLSLSSAGVVSGTPAFYTAAENNGTYTFSVVATDSSGLTSAAVSFTIYVTVGPKIPISNLPPGVVGTGYAHDVERIGGVNTFNGTLIATRLTWAATGLPPGLSINSSTGRITGTPSSATGSPFSVNLSVTDAHGIIGTKTVQLTIRNAGLTLDLELPRGQEPCPVNVISYNCSPRGFKVATLKQSYASPSTAKYLVYSATLSASTIVAPVTRIYIAALDSNGRFSQPQTPTVASSGTTEYTPASTPFITSLDVGDIDNDGHPDIVFADHFNNRISIVWNAGTQDASGNPQFTTQSNFNMPAGGTASNRPYQVKIANIRPLGVDAGKKDLIVTDWSFAIGGGGSIVGTGLARIATFLAASACSSSCVASRATIYTSGGGSTNAISTVMHGAANGLINMSNINIGYFNTAPGAGICPSIVVSGKIDSAATIDYLFLRHQTFSGGVCTGTFNVAPVATDRVALTAATAFAGGIAVADLNNDGISDIAVTLRTAQTNSASLKVFLMPGGNAFPTAISPLLPFTTGVTYGASYVVPYCVNGSSSCTFPGLLVVGNRDGVFSTTAIGTGATGTGGFVSVFTNNGSSPFFFDASAQGRIDYAAPNGINNEPVLMPIAARSVASNVNDLMFMGNDIGSYPYYFLLTRNGTNTTNPFRAAPMWRAFPDEYAAMAEPGTIKLADVDLDINGELDVFSHLVNQAAISMQVSDATNKTSSKDPSTQPEPTFNVMGVTHAYPRTVHQPYTMDVSDFNNDGYPDTVVTGYASRSVAVALGDGTSHLGAGILFEVGTSGDLRPDGVVAQDFDQDGFQDIITWNNALTAASSSMSFLRGKGDGTFYPAIEFFQNNGTGCGTDIRAVVAKDINGDGRPELTYLCYSAQALFIARRHTDGTWIRQQGATLNTGPGTNGVALRVGRLTSTTGVDIVVSGLDLTNTMRIVYGVTINTPDASGNFTPSGTAASFIRLNGYANDLEIADLDVDGYGDIAINMVSQNLTTSLTGFLMYTCRSTGTPGACTLAAWNAEQLNPTGIAIGDINYDGLPDIVQGGKIGQRLFFRTLSRYFNSSY